jgi:hypothetical protein
MSENYQNLDDNRLHELRRKYRRDLLHFQERMQSGEDPKPLEQERNAAIEAVKVIDDELRRRELFPSSAKQPHKLPPLEANPQRASCPFRVGEPLHKDEPLFGRKKILEAVARELKRPSSITIVGKRWRGKTSFLNHLVGNAEYLGLSYPPYLIARLDTNDNITSAERFYGTALREFLYRFPANYQMSGHLAELKERLAFSPVSSYDECRAFLQEMSEQNIIPILALDDFERLAKHCRHGDFPLPTFFENLRALSNASLLTFVVTAKKELDHIFEELPPSFTSSFPGFFNTHHLEKFDEEAAEELLFQESDYPLSPTEVQEACRYAGKSEPLLLQAAGKAWYETKASGEPMSNAHRRFLAYQRVFFKQYEGPDNRETEK